MLYLVFIKPTSGYIRQRMLITFVGFGFWLVGLLVRFYPTFVSLYPIPSVTNLTLHMIGMIFIIISILMVSYGFSAFETFTDLNWKEKLRELYVISGSGICMYAYSFEKNQPLADADLLAGGFSGIQLLLSEMVKTTESLQLIDYQNVKIMVEQTADIIFVLIITEESSFLPYKLKLFSEEFHTFFKDILQHWIGELNAFQPSKTLIQRIFEIEINI